jgi:uncharacterized protein
MRPVHDNRPILATVRKPVDRSETRNEKTLQWPQFRARAARSGTRIHCNGRGSSKHCCLPLSIHPTPIAQSLECRNLFICRIIVQNPCLAIHTVMTRSDLIQLLRRNREELHRNFGVRSLALFGSTARQNARDTSDVDLLVEFDRPVGLLHLIGTQQRLEALLGVPKVDLVLRHTVIPDLRDNILSEAVDVFGPQEVEVSPAAHAAGNR